MSLQVLTRLETWLIFDSENIRISESFTRVVSNSSADDQLLKHVLEDFVLRLVKLYQAMLFLDKEHLKLELDLLNKALDQAYIYDSPLRVGGFNN